MIEKDSKTSKVTIPTVLLGIASSLTLSRDDIVNQHKLRPIAYAERELNNLMQYSIEIRLNDIFGDLMYLFDENLQCTSAFLFLDHGFPVLPYIDFLNDNYSYDYNKGWWIMPECEVGMIKIAEDTCLCFQRSTVGISDTLT